MSLCPSSELLLFPTPPQESPFSGDSFKRRKAFLNHQFANERRKRRWPRLDSQRAVSCDISPKSVYLHASLHGGQAHPCDAAISYNSRSPPSPLVLFAPQRTPPKSPSSVKLPFPKASSSAPLFPTPNLNAPTSFLSSSSNAPSWSPKTK